MNQDYHCRITANIKGKEAFNKIKRVSEWWATNMEGKAQNLNDVFTVRFGETYGTFKITEMIPGKKMEWQVTDNYMHLLKNKTEWKGTKIIWELSHENNSTQISMTHIGLVPGIECYDDCKKGWDFYLKESLFKLMARDKGIPGTGIRATISNGKRTYEGILFSRNAALPDFADEWILIDVKETCVEHVISSYGVSILNKENFNTQQLKGENYMVVENKPLFKVIQPLEDIMATVK